jgi:hypothetical protein
MWVVASVPCDSRSRMQPRPGARIDGVNAAERKAARARWESRVFDGDWEEMADYDALFWDRIPVDERAEAVWQASKELYEVAPEGDEGPRRLGRSESGERGQGDPGAPRVRRAPGKPL